MSWLKKVFSSRSSQETKFVIEKTKEDKKEDKPQIENLNIEEEAEKESSKGNQDRWFSSWSGLSTTYSSPKKRDLSDDEDEEGEKWWSSFCIQETKSELVFSTQASSSSSQVISSQPFGLTPNLC